MQIKCARLQLISIRLVLCAFGIDAVCTILYYVMENKIDSTAITRVVRFVPNVFVHFTGFKGEYLVYLTEKRVKWAERGGAKMAAGVVAVESK